ncbi:hypothetical protein EIP86_008508 [Pleurotus ostreatoroseus]|nr:hypothetical protein EIP86_008508 [Pleurotus ostreatoroseus]
MPIVDLIPPASLSPSDVNAADTGETCIRSSTKRKHSGSNTSGNPSKRRRLDEKGAEMRASAHTSGNVTKRQSPADITLSRTRLFYFRPSGQGEIAHGLPASHILNSLIVDHKLAIVDPAASVRKQQDNARHLAKYAIVVTKTVIPMQFWGSKRNFKVELDVKTLITMRRFETLSLHTLLQNFVMSDCDWLLLASSNTNKTHKIPISDSLKRLELLQEFLYWYFDSFLIPLLKTSFYVTESQAFRNKVLYFRQDDWEILCRPLIEKLCSNTFQKLRQNDAEEILRQRNLGYSFVRLLPKETGVRPIINLRRRVLAMPYKRSINQILKAAFHILTYEKDCQRNLVGASSFGPNETYQRLKAFKATLQRDFPDELPQLYFVKMDVQACFDTIDQTKLLQILLQVLKEDSYVIERHGQVSSQCNRVKRNFVSTAYPLDDYPDFLAVAAQLASALRNTIFVDKVVYPDAKRSEIIQLLEQHITDNIVKIGNDYYRQIVGIPQGSILSTLLCSFFYGDLERTKLKFTDDPHTVLLRLVDDYLLVTTNRKRARLFYDVMNKGHPEYGCFISQDKTLTNFDDGDMFNVIDPSQRGTQAAMQADRILTQS